MTYHAQHGLGWSTDRVGTTDHYDFRVRVKGLPSGATSSGLSASVPDWVMRAFRSYPGTFLATTAGWEEGGLLHVHYSSVASHSDQRAAIIRALTRAAQTLGAQVYFEFQDQTIIPADRDPDRATSVSSSTVSVRELQQLLLRKGFDVGPTGADGIWGSSTQRALASALGSDVRVNLPPRATEIALPSAELTRLRALPDRAVGTAQPAAPRADAPPIEIEPPPSGSSEAEQTALQILPWAIGAVALVGIGGYFMWRGRHSGRMATANRRRRRR